MDKDDFAEALGADVVIPDVAPEMLALRDWWDRERRQPPKGRDA